MGHNYRRETNRSYAYEAFPLLFLITSHSCTLLVNKRDTLLVQTNTSAVSVPYEMFFEKANERDDPCFYKVAPCRGRISSGGQQVCNSLITVNI